MSTAGRAPTLPFLRLSQEGSGKLGGAVLLAACFQTLAASGRRLARLRCARAQTGRVHAMPGGDAVTPARLGQAATASLQQSLRCQLSGLCYPSLTGVSAVQVGLEVTLWPRLVGAHTASQLQGFRWGPGLEKAWKRGSALVFGVGRGARHPGWRWCLGWNVALAEASVAQL